MIKIICLAICFLSATVFSSSLFALSNTKSEKIIIPLNNWTSQRVLSKAVGIMLQRLGRTVDYQDITAHDQWGALRLGLIHFQIEIWQASMGVDFNNMVKNNFIEDLGTHSAIGKEEWWYPQYVEKKCLGLPNWKAINSCSHLFSESPSSTIGVYYTGLWDFGDADIIRSLNLNFTIKRLPDDKALWTVLKSAAEEKRPIMLLNWTPNWTDVRIKGKFVEFPEYTPECESDPAWGINKLLAKDCGNPKQGWIKKAAWTGLQKQQPCVYQLIKRIDFSHEMIAEAAALVIADGYSEEEAAKIWMKKYNNHITSWLNLSCNTANTNY